MSHGHPPISNRRMMLPALALLLGACTRYAEPEIHLVPAGYMGSVDIIHDVLDGVPARYEAGARVYEIPTDGILRSATPVPQGRWGPGDVRYFFVARDGARTPIADYWSGAIHDTPANRADPAIGVYSRSVGSVWFGGMSCPVVHEHYSVGTKSYLLDHPESPHGRLDEYLKQHPVQCSRRHDRRRRVLAPTAPRP